MKKFISIILVCVLILSSLLLTSCDLFEKEKKSSDKKSNKTEVSTPSPVKNVNGKNARQLLEDALNEYSQSESYDLSMTMKTTENGKKTTETIVLKLNKTSFYLDMTMDGTDMEVWFVDNVAYINNEGEKYKTSASSADDLFGEGFIDSLLDMVPLKIPEAYFEKMEDAQIYSLKGEYYFTIELTAEEALEIFDDDTAITETFRFDSKGNITQISSEQEASDISILIKSYGKDIKISKPKDANKYDEKPAETINPSETLPNVTPPQEENNDTNVTTQSLYDEYLQLLKQISSAQAYVMDIFMEEELYLSYVINSKGQQYVLSREEGYDHEMWIVSGKGYVSISNQTPIQTAITSDMLQSCESANELRYQLTKEPIALSDMENLQRYPRDLGLNEKGIYFNYTEEGIMYSYYIYYGDSYIDFTITSFYNNTLESINYVFDFTDVPLNVPI